MTIYARFMNASDGNIYDVLMNSEYEVEIPHEVTDHPGTFKVALRAESHKRVITSDIETFEVIATIDGDSATPSEPTETIFQSLAAAAATTTDLQSGFDTQSILNKLNGINSGICDGFYAMNTSLLQGFNGQQMATMQGNYNTQTAINCLSSQLANCCCENRQGQADIKYAMATDTCAVTNSISNAARDITDNANANYRQLHDELVAMRMEDKDAQIADLTRQLGQKDLAASQCAQNAYLISQLHPSPIPAFNVPNPNATVGYGCYCNQA